jgi:hypothetical protein
MFTAWRAIGRWLIVLGLAALPGARGMCDEPAPNTPRKHHETLSLVFTVATPPGGDTIKLAGYGTVEAHFKSQIALRSIAIRDDGTFAFDGCDAGFIENDQYNRRLNGVTEETHLRWQATFRGHGQIIGDAIKLEVEWSHGNGYGITRASDGSTTDSTFTVRPGDPNVTLKAQYTRAGTAYPPTVSSFPLKWQKTTWELKAEPAVAAAKPAGGGLRRLAGGSSSLALLEPAAALSGVLLAPAAGAVDHCDPHPERQFQGRQDGQTDCPGAQLRVRQQIEARRRDCDCHADLDTKIHLTRWTDGAFDFDFTLTNADGDTMPSAKLVLKFDPTALDDALWEGAGIITGDKVTFEPPTKFIDYNSDGTETRTYLYTDLGPNDHRTVHVHVPLPPGFKWSPPVVMAAEGLPGCHPFGQQNLLNDPKNSNNRADFDDLFLPRPKP